jgi:hypothetical protein
VGQVKLGATNIQELAQKVDETVATGSDVSGLASRMLGSGITHAANYTAAVGEMGIQESAGKTTTLPSAAKGQVVGVFCKAASCSVFGGGVFIYGLSITAASKTTTINLTEGQHIILMFDGTNWAIIDGEPKEGRAVRTGVSSSGEPAVMSWGLIERPAGSFIIAAGSGDYTLSNPEEGKFIFKWKTAKASASYAVVVTPARNAGGEGTPALPIVSVSATEFTVELTTSAGAKVSDKFSFIVMAGS